MKEALLSNPFIWLVLTLGVFRLLTMIQGEFNHVIIKSLFNPLLLTIAVIILILKLNQIPYQDYAQGGHFISFMIAPATVSLAIKLEENFEYLRRYFKVIVSSIVMGVIIHTTLIVILAILFKFDYAMVATLYPKSITTAIAIGVSESLGGIVSLTVAVVVFTGVIGAMLSETVFGIFKITDPVAQGVALGTSAHAMGTAKAIQLGDVQGAMSSISIIMTGIVVVLLAPLVEPILQWLIK